MERMRRELAAISIGLLVAGIVATLIEGREFLRVRAISLAYGHDYRDAVVVFSLVMAGTLAFTGALLALLSATRSSDRKGLIVAFAFPLSFFACLPVYWYTYRDTPPGWHINIAKAHRWAQPAGVAAALLVYVVSHVVTIALRIHRARTASLGRSA
jgi:hypothetical protein